MRVASSSAAACAGSFTAAVALLASAGAPAVDAKGFGSPPPAAPAVPQRPPRRHDYRLTFKQPYYFNNSIPFFETFGNTIPSEEYIRLAASVPGLKGSIWAKDPNKHPEWEVEFSFRASGRGTTGGEGLAFWYTKDRAQEGPVFGSKDKWDGVGIFFDTYDEKANRNSPLVYSVINDGSKELAKSSSTDQLNLGSCWRDYRNPVGPVWVRVSYYGKRLAVDIDTVKKGKSYISCFEGHEIGLPIGYYFGVSAMAGRIPDDHDVISFEHYEVNPPALQEHPLRPHEKERIAQGKAFSVTDDAKKHIEEVERKIEDVRHKKEEELQSGHVDTAALTHQIHETQFRIVDSLGALYDKLEHVGAPAKPEELPANVESRLGAMSASLTGINSQLRSLAETVTALTIQLRDSQGSPGSGGGQSEHFISQMHKSVQDMQTKLEIIQNRNAHHEAHAEHESGDTSTLLYLAVFFGLQVFILWYFGRRKPEAPKKFI